MRKIILSVLLLFVVNTVLLAQFSGTNCVQGTKLNMSFTLMDEVFACTGSSSNPELSYSYNVPTTFKWYKYTSNPSSKVLVFTESTTLSNLTSTFNSPDMNCGYVVEFDGKTKYCWLLDMSSYQLVLSQMPTASKGSVPCVNVDITIYFAKLSELFYYNSAGTRKTIPRVMSVKYNTLEWDGSAAYTTKEVSVQREVTGGPADTIQHVSVPAPLCKTSFIVSGDVFLSALNLAKTTSNPSFEFTPFAVAQHLTGKVSEREFLNEIERTSGTLGGSAPLNVEFKSNTNYPICQYFEWYVISKENPNDQVYYTDQDLRYTFKKTGLYTVKLKASNAECASIDSINVNVIASSLEVPNVFTPNGDGKNDEFRVAYKSLVKFEGVVFNRWGRVVYRWSDPGRGWDGRINGRMATPGAYYYIIEATGSDLDPNTKKPITYKKKGDINLLRGK